jgi:hypothetical protein
MAGSSGLGSNHPTQHLFKHENLSRIPKAGSSGHGVGSSDRQQKFSGLEAGSSDPGQRGTARQTGSSGLGQRKICLQAVSSGLGPDHPSQMNLEGNFLKKEFHLKLKHFDNLDQSTASPFIVRWSYTQIQNENLN